MDDRLPDGWTVWNEDAGGRLILAFRPDVFDSEAFPAPCLPTIYVTNGNPGGPGRRRPDRRAGGADRWRTVFFLEPEIELDRAEHDSRPAAIDAAVETATAFAGGEVDYRSAYQVPRQEYFEKLDELVG